MAYQKEGLPNFYNDLHVERPVHLAADVTTTVFQKDIPKAVDSLMKGENVLVSDYFGSGLSILQELSKVLRRTHKDNSFEGQRAYRSAYHDKSQHLLLRITNHQLEVKKAPSIGWLQVLYPELESFILPFTKVQGLNSAWQWYEKGVSFPVLRNKVHPYFGTYFPSRTEHLVLFDNWLKRYEGPKKSAFDVGIGSGVLALMMMKHKFQLVFGTDTNPNAIVGLQIANHETKLSRKILLSHGSLFADFEQQSELIVFNPPWLPAKRELDRLDEAIYYKETLFEDFFTAAVDRLSPDGRIVLLFSNLGQITGLSDTNPIEQELLQNDRFEKELMLTKKVAKASTETKRDQHWRTEEEVQLWVLKLKQS